MTCETFSLRSAIGRSPARRAHRGFHSVLLNIFAKAQRQLLSAAAAIIEPWRLLLSPQLTRLACLNHKAHHGGRMHRHRRRRRRAFPCGDCLDRVLVSVAVGGQFCGHLVEWLCKPRVEAWQCEYIRVGSYALCVRMRVRDAWVTGGTKGLPMVGRA